MARYRQRRWAKYLRADGAFACPKVYQYLEQEGVRSAMRLPENPVLHRQIEPLVTRPADWSQGQTVVQYYDLHYQAANWERSRRVVAQVKWHPGQLFPDTNFVVTNLTAPPRAVVRFYNRRGTAKQSPTRHPLSRLRCRSSFSAQAREGHSCRLRHSSLGCGG